MTHPYAEKWFSEKKQLLESIAISLRVQAAAGNRDILTPLSSVVRRLLSSVTSAEALGMLSLTQAQLLQGMSKHKKAIEAAEKSMVIVAVAATNLLPGLVVLKAQSMALSGVSEPKDLQTLRKQMKLCENAPVELRSATISAVAMAHYCAGDIKKARKLMQVAIDINARQALAEVNAANWFADERTLAWQEFIAEEYGVKKAKVRRAPRPQ